MKHSFFIKGVVCITSLTPFDFEIADEDFFYTGLEPRGEFLSQGDIDVYACNELKELDWGFDPELDMTYAFLYEFTLSASQDYFGDHDTDINCIRLEFSKMDIEDFAFEEDQVRKDEE